MMCTASACLFGARCDAIYVYVPGTGIEFVDETGVMAASLRCCGAGRFLLRIPAIMQSAEPPNLRVKQGPSYSPGYYMCEKNLGKVTRGKTVPAAINPERINTASDSLSGVLPCH